MREVCCVATQAVLCCSSSLIVAVEHGQCWTRAAADQPPLPACSRTFIAYQPQPFNPLQGHCWVLADNEQLEPPHVIDSRSFGPLPLSNVVGRCAGFVWRKACWLLCGPACLASHAPQS